MALTFESITATNSDIATLVKKGRTFTVPNVEAPISLSLNAEFIATWRNGYFKQKTVIKNTAEILGVLPENIGGRQACAHFIIACCNKMRPAPCHGFPATNEQFMLVQDEIALLKDQEPDLFTDTVIINRQFESFESLRERPRFIVPPMAPLVSR